MKKKNDILKKLLLTSSILAFCVHIENVRSDLSDDVVAVINALPAAVGNPGALGNHLAAVAGEPAALTASRAKANFEAILYRASRLLNIALPVAAVVGVNPGTAVNNVWPTAYNAFNEANNASASSVGAITAINVAVGANPAAKTVLANAAPVGGMLHRERSLFRKLVNVRHLWKWPIAGAPVNANLNYLAWCRAARIQNGIPGVGSHTSFFVPAGINANVYFVELLNRIAVASAGVGNVSVTHNGLLIAGPAALGGAALAPHFAPALPAAHIVQIFVNVAGAANIGGTPIQGIKCRLINVPLPAALAPVGAVPGGPPPNNVLDAIEAGSSIRETLYTNAHVGGGGVAGAFFALHGGGVAATAAMPQNVSVIQIRIETNVGGGTSISLFPI